MHGVCMVCAWYMHGMHGVRMVHATCTCTCMAHAWCMHMRGICMVYTRPEPMNTVVAGDHYNSGCCFDYGNAEVDALDDGKGTMAAVQPLTLALTLTLTLTPGPDPNPDPYPGSNPNCTNPQPLTPNPSTTEAIQPLALTLTPTLTPTPDPSP